MSAVIGLDLSSTCTGICLPDGGTAHFAPPKGTVLSRAVAIRDWLRDWVAPPVDLIVIEDIGTRFTQTAIAMAYVHCCVDQLLMNQRTIKVAPAVLKRFATGKGNADKHAMTVAAIRNGWACDGEEGSTDDECDAWWLWALGWYMLDAPVMPVPVTQYRTDVCAGLAEETA